MMNVNSNNNYNGRHINGQLSLASIGSNNNNNNNIDSLPLHSVPCF